MNWSPSKQIPDATEYPKFFSTKREIQALENQSTLYSILTQLDNYERVYLKGTLSDKIYESECQKLILRCNAAFSLVKEEGFNSLEEFCIKYHAKFPLALTRVREGKPITMLAKGGSDRQAVASIITLFITIADKIGLSIFSIDELYPDLRDLNSTLQNFSSKSDDFKLKVKEWCDVMEKMSANDELDASSARQFLFDINNSLTMFNKSLENS